VIYLNIFDRIQLRVKQDGTGAVQPIAPAPETNLDFNYRKKELQAKTDKSKIVDIYC
jgi:hypothetical protein